MPTSFNFRNVLSNSCTIVLFRTDLEKRQFYKLADYGSGELKLFRLLLIRESLKSQKALSE